MIFLRHPTPQIERGTCYGRLDIELAPAATKQILRAVNRLNRVPRLISSPAKRCMGLARAISEAFEVEIEADERLWELHFGAWEGQRWDRINRTDSDPWAEDPWSLAPPGGETFADLSARVAAVLSEVPEDSVIVSHAGPIRAARMTLTGMRFEQAFAGHVPYATPIRIARRGP